MERLEDVGALPVRIPGKFFATSRVAISLEQLERLRPADLIVVVDDER